MERVSDHSTTHIVHMVADSVYDVLVQIVRVWDGQCWLKTRIDERHVKRAQDESKFQKLVDVAHAELVKEVAHEIIAERPN